jgi:glycosyltransferase involved in cell wall biosynthesis
MKRLAIITTHPIQYYAPLFALLQRRGNIAVRVFYTWGEASVNKLDPGFGQAVNWDLPLLEGYPFEWVENTSAEPGSHHFKGIINPSLISRVEQFGADAILVFGWAYNGHLKAMRHFKSKKPVYFRGDSTLLDGSWGIRKVVRSFFLRWVYSYVDHAFYVGANNKAYLKKFGLDDSQLSFGPHAIDNDRFATKFASEAFELRKRLGVSDGDILILFAGKFEEKKSPELLLEVFLTLEQPGVHLLLTGNGQLEETLKLMASGAGNVHFMNFQNQSQMPVVYQACDLFCLPSKGPGETWGLAVNEAMACGKAVITSDKVGCAVDLVSNENGVIFPSGNGEALGDALQSVLKDKSRLIKMGNASSNRIAPWNFTNIAVAIENKLLNEAK